MEYIQITFVSLYKMQLAKVRSFAYNKDRTREAESLPNYLPYTRKGDGVTMLKLWPNGCTVFWIRNGPTVCRRMSTMM